MYNKLFDILYTTEISEEAKTLIVEKFNIQIDESVETCSPYVEYINTLIYSNITEACLSDVIETTFSKLSEAEIDVLTEEFMKASVMSYISEAGFKFYGDPRPIGLTGLRKEAAKQENKVAEPKKPSAMDKLKSAVGKVKSWVGSLERQPNPVGISKLQAEKDARIKKAVEMGTGPKAPEAPKAEVKQASAPKAPKQPKASKPAAPKASKIDKAVKAAEEPVKPLEKESTKLQTPAKAKKATAAVKPDSEQLKLDVEQPKVEAKKTKAGAKGKADKKVEPKVEQPVAAKNSKKTTKKTSTKKANTVADNVAKKVEPKKEKVIIKRGRKPKNTNEALADFVCLLSDTNISESAVEEIVEMISNKKVAEKAIDKEYKEFTKAADALNKAVELATKTGMPVDPDLSKKAEEKGERYEHFKALADKKFGA